MQPGAARDRTGDIIHPELFGQFMRGEGHRILAIGQTIFDPEFLQCVFRRS
ncbi:hypothetical protein KAM346_44230 [Aeromonas caviae]|nr:hypothetical protein KAM346_44230 [Aeromonas caviae]